MKLTLNQLNMIISDTMSTMVVETNHCSCLLDKSNTGNEPLSSIVLDYPKIFEKFGITFNNGLKYLGKTLIVRYQ